MALRITKKDLIERVTEIFKSRDKAREWMKEPHKALEENHLRNVS
jgi:uncharacterized protein (DUF2384 family)